MSLSSKLGGRPQDGDAEAKEREEVAHPGTEERTPEMPRN